MDGKSMSTDLTVVHERKYMHSGRISSIPYFAEGPYGYGDCPALAALGVSRYMCRAQGVKGSIVRTYAGLVPISDPRASAHRRYVAGIGELAYMKGSYAIYVAKKDVQILRGGWCGFTFKASLAKRLAGYENTNYHVYIRSGGGRGAIKLCSDREPGPRSTYTTVVSLDFDEDVGKIVAHEWRPLLDTGTYQFTWQREFWGSAPEVYVEYPGDTLA